jgi:hypothetical protein
MLLIPLLPSSSNIMEVEAFSSILRADNQLNLPPIVKGLDKPCRKEEIRDQLTSHSTNSKLKSNNLSIDLDQISCLKCKLYSELNTILIEALLKSR